MRRACLTIASLGLMFAFARAAVPIRVMLLDGESAGSYHKWRATTPVLKKELDETGLLAVNVRDTHPPIMKGLPPVWMHQGDELYARLRGPGQHMTVLATAYSDPANRGPGRDEPQLMALSFGRGRIFHTTLGHDVNALS